MRTFSLFRSGRSINLMTAAYSEKNHEVSFLEDDEVNSEKDKANGMDQRQFLLGEIKTRYKRPKHYSSSNSRHGEVVACIVLAISMIVATIMWSTDWYNRIIYKRLVFEENGPNVDLWMNPKWEPLVSVYIFNYTNVDAVLAGKEKPNVQEIGPYVFREKSKKVNVTFHANGTVTYQLFRNVTFVPELTTGDLNDTINTPNTLLFTTIAKMKFGFWMSLGNYPIFNTMTANELIMGYENWMLKVGSILTNNAVPSKIGLLSKRVGLSKSVITMNTGKYDMNLYGVNERINGELTLGKWGNKECDKLSGTDGTIYPPTLIANKKPLSVFTEGSCRAATLSYEKELTSEGMPVVRYVVDPSMFNYANNSCFCLDGECPVNGTQNLAPCTFGSPVYTSLPHFKNVDEAVYNGVTGLLPQFKNHTNYFDIHQILGVLIGGKSSTQVNILAKNTDSYKPLKVIKDGTYLPIAWIELDLTKPPSDMIQLLYRVTCAIIFFKMFLQYGLTIVILMCLLYIAHKHKILLMPSL